MKVYCENCKWHSKDWLHLFKSYCVVIKPYGNKFTGFSSNLVSYDKFKKNLKGDCSEYKPKEAGK